MRPQPRRTGSDRLAIVKMLLWLARHLQHHDRGLTIPEIAALMHCSRRTAERRVALLREVFVLEDGRDSDATRRIRLRTTGFEGMPGLTPGHLDGLQAAIEALMGQGNAALAGRLHDLALLLRPLVAPPAAAP